MIAVKTGPDRVEVTIPTDGMTPAEVNNLLSWLHVEDIARHSKLTPEASEQLSGEIKSDW